MSFVESHLQSGERILYRANRGHTWYDILLAIVLTFLVAPLALALYMFAMNFLIQIIAAILPSGPEGQLVLMLLIVGLMVITRCWRSTPRSWISLPSGRRTWS